MALSTTVLRRHAVRPSAPASRRVLVAPMPRQTACKSQLLSTLAEVGEVDAPIGVVVGAAVLITVAATALVPLALNPGQQAADKIFKGKSDSPLDKRETIVSPKGKGKGKK